MRQISAWSRRIVVSFRDTCNSGSWLASDGRRLGGVDETARPFAAGFPDRLVPHRRRTACSLAVRSLTLFVVLAHGVFIE